MEALVGFRDQNMYEFEFMYIYARRTIALKTHSRRDAAFNYSRKNFDNTPA